MAEVLHKSEVVRISMILLALIQFIYLTTEFLIIKCSIDCFFTTLLLLSHQVSSEESKHSSVLSTNHWNTVFIENKTFIPTLFSWVFDILSKNSQ